MQIKSMRLSIMEGAILACVVLTFRVSWCIPVTPSIPSETLYSNSSKDEADILEGSGNDSYDADFNRTTSTTADWRLIYRQREKEEQLMLIQLRVLNGLGISKPPNRTSSIFTKEQRKTMSHIFNKVINNTDNNKFSSDQHYVHRLQSFYPSCAMPGESDKKLWDKRNKFYIFYNVDQALGEGVDVTSATLHLWQHVQDSMEVTTADPDDVHPWFGSKDTPNEDESEVYKTTVYALLKPLKRSSRVKRKRIASKQSSPSDSGWQEFNVKPAIKDWLNGHQNFGFEIRVQDKNGASLNPNDVYSHMNCSLEKKKVLPFPKFIERLPTFELGENESLSLDNLTYPTLDLHTTLTESLDPTSSQQVQRVISISPDLNLSDLNDLSNNSSSEAKILLDRRRRSSCSCHMFEHRFNIEDFQLEFLVAPKVLHTSTCNDLDEDDISKDMVCRPMKTSDVTFTYEDSEGVSKNITIADLNESDCQCVPT